MGFFGRNREQRTIAVGGPVLANRRLGARSRHARRWSLAVADVLACVRVLAGAAASLPLDPVSAQGDGRVRLTSGRLYDLLQAPSPATTQANLVAQSMAHLLLHGNAYLGKFRVGDGRLEQLSLPRPDERAGRARRRLPPLHGHRSEDGPRERPRHRRHHCTSGRFSTDGLVGLSPVEELQAGGRRYARA